MSQHLVLVGGGHSHVQVIKAFGNKPMREVKVTVICRDRFTPYSGMLPGLIAGHYEFGDAHIHLARLTHYAGAELIEDEVTGIDLRARKVLRGDGPAISFDVLSINTGSTPGMANVAGAAEFAVPVKPIGQFLEHWKRLQRKVIAADGRARIGVVGGGAGGVELVLSMQFRMQRVAAEMKLAKVPRFTLITAAPELLEGQARSTARRFWRILAERGIEVRPSFHVTQVSAAGVSDPTGREVGLDQVLWVTDAAPADWLRASGLATDSQGFVSVTDTLQSASHSGVFAAGDVASMRNNPRPKSGVFAVRQGPPLTANLRATLAGKNLRAYRPQQSVLSLIGTGDRYAVATRGGWSVEGRWVWRWKEWIDRRFMRRFNQLPR